MKKLSFSILFLIFLFTFWSCQELVNDFKMMTKIQQIIAEKINVEVGIKITNGKMISVTLVNTKYNDMSGIKQHALAKEIGEIIFSNLDEENKKRIEFGQVIFVKSSNYIIFNSSESSSFDMDLKTLRGEKNENVEQ